MSGLVKKPEEILSEALDREDADLQWSESPEIRDRHAPECPGRPGYKGICDCGAEFTGSPLSGAVPKDDSFLDVIGAAEQREPFPNADPREILGALNDGLKNSPAFRKLLQQRIARSRPIIQSVTPKKARFWSMGFGPIDIQPGATTVITSQPRVYFRGEKIIYAGDQDGNFRADLFIGQKIQFQDYPMSMAAQNASALYDGPKLDTCPPALQFYWKVTNIGRETKRWAASIVGKCVD